MTVDEAIKQAIAHHEAGRLAEAEQLYRAVLNTVPDHPTALHLLGVVAHQVGQYQPAIDLIRRSLAIQPTAGAWSNLGEALRQGGKPEEAVEAYRRAIVVDPNFASAYSNLGLALRTLHRFAEAEPVLRQAVRLAPNFAAAHQNLCNTLGDLGRTAEAVAAGRRATELAPNVPSAWSDYGVACVEHGDLSAAALAFERSIQLDPGRADSHHNLAQVLLRTGDFPRGWEEYEWRWKSPGFPSPARNFPQPLWDGSPIEGKRILLHAEQGFGDALMFARYIPMVVGRGARVTVECQRELVPLFRSVAADVQLIPRGEPLPDFDLHCPFLSLPRAFRTTVDTIPNTVPYLHPDPVKLATWRDRLSSPSPATGNPQLATLKLGIVWAGRPSHANDHNRSVSLARFAPLADIPGVNFYSLQLGPSATQAATPPPGLRLVDLSSDLRDYADTAAAVANLDLVISVDTSVVHLAGALGKPVWTLLPFAGDWRWIVGRDDSPWYPTMRLFRPKQWGGWDEVFDRVRGELMGRITK